jgi:hypothetical protein
LSSRTIALFLFISNSEAINPSDIGGIPWTDGRAIATTSHPYRATQHQTNEKIWSRNELDATNMIIISYVLDDRGSIPGRDWDFFSWPPRPDRLWGPPSLLSNRYWELFPLG